MDINSILEQHVNKSSRDGTILKSEDIVNNICYDTDTCRRSSDVEIPSIVSPVSPTVIERAIQNKRRIAIRPARLKYLQMLESNLKSEIHIEESKKYRLKKLHETEKENITAVKKRVKKYVEKNREEINKRRREKRLQAKLACVVLKTSSKSDKCKVTSSDKNILNIDSAVIEFS